MSIEYVWQVEGAYTDIGGVFQYLGYAEMAIRSKYEHKENCAIQWNHVSEYVEECEVSYFSDNGWLTTDHDTIYRCPFNQLYEY